MPVTIGLCAGLLCGRSAGWPITDAYRPPFAFTGELVEVKVELGREALIRDDEAEMRMVTTHQ